MNKTIIHCKTTAPVFMAGADKNKPELRTSSIKGCMRFIWRAIQRADDAGKLRDREGELFGNAYGGRATKASIMRIRIDDRKINTSTGCEMLPHRKSNDYKGDRKGQAFSQPAIGTDSAFDVIITSFTDEKTHIKYVRLFALTCLLYGFGRRSRKGFGTVVITGIEGSGNSVDYRTIDGATENLKVLSEFGAEYSTADDKQALIAKGGGGSKYPYIEKIVLIGEPDFTETAPIIEQIGLSTHEYSGSEFIGKARPRYASSVLLSTTLRDDGKYGCIATQLHCPKNTDNRESFYDYLGGRLQL